MKIAVLGAGAWGTAISALLSARHSVVLYARNPEQCALLARDRVNARYLPSLALSGSLRFTDDLHVAVKHTASDSGLILVATPTAALRSIVRTDSIAPVVHFVERFVHRLALGPAHTKT